MEAISQVRRYPLSNNEDLDIVDNEPESGDDMLEIDMEIF